MTTLHHPIVALHIHHETKRSLVRQFMTWCRTQDKNRLLWLAIILTAHACIITPLTLAFIMLSGNSMFFWALAIGAMSMSLVSNLAALPTKYTLPVFFLSLVIDIVIIINCIGNGLIVPGS